jgi:hypothetical protein
VEPLTQRHTRIGVDDIATLVADIVGSPHALSERQVVFLQLGHHVFECDVTRVMSSMCFTLAMRPIERFVVPPILRALSAISSVIAKI